MSAPYLWGVPSQEWLDFEEMGLRTVIPHQWPEKQKVEAENAARTKTSQDVWAALGLSDRVLIEDNFVTVPNGTITVRLYVRKSFQIKFKPIYVYFHPGNFQTGSIPTEDASLGRLVDALDIVVIHVCYRHVPEHIWPAQLDDAFAAYDWIVRSGKLEVHGGDTRRIVLGGIGAGALLAINVVLQVIGTYGVATPRIKGLLLCQPWLSHPARWASLRPTMSYVQCKNSPILSRDAFFEAIWLAKLKDGDIRCSPVDMEAEVAKKFPRTAFLIAGMDILRDDALVLLKRLNEAETPTNLRVYPGLPHGFQQFQELPSTTLWNQAMVEDLRWCFFGVD